MASQLIKAILFAPYGVSIQLLDTENFNEKCLTLEEALSRQAQLMSPLSEEDKMKLHALLESDKSGLF